VPAWLTAMQASAASGGTSSSSTSTPMSGTGTF
jgi:hypothetical protein